MAGKQKILIISRDDKSRKRLAEILQKASYECQDVCDIAQAAQAAERQLFDAIVLESLERAESPSSLVERLCREAPLRGVPLILGCPEPLRFSESQGATPREDVYVVESPISASSLLVKIATAARVWKTHLERANLDETVAEQNKQLQDLTERFRREIADAREVHESILPSVLPCSADVEFAAVYKPRDEVGGDLYDVWVIDDGVYGLFLADVTGTGLPAAFVGAMTRIALSYASSLAPDEMLRHMNRGMSPYLPPGRLVMATAVRFSLKDRSVSVSTAGNPDIVVYRGADRSVEYLGTSGLAIGTDYEAKYEITRTALVPGDKVLIVTDGVPDTANMDGQVWGIQGIGESFLNSACEHSIRDCLNKLTKAQESFACGRIIKDDFTLLGFELRS